MSLDLPGKGLIVNVGPKTASRENAMKRLLKESNDEQVEKLFSLLYKLVCQWVSIMGALRWSYPR